MNEVSEAVTRWLEHKRRTERASAAMIAALALGSGIALFLLTTLLIYAVLAPFCGGLTHSVAWVWPIALALAAWFFVRNVKAGQRSLDLGLDPMGLWVLKEIFSVGPRLIAEALRELRRYGLLGEFNVVACAQALTYLALHNSAVPVEELIKQCPHVPWLRLQEQLSLLDGVLFLGENSSRVTLMEPFRVRLRWMLEPELNAKSAQGTARPTPHPPPRVPVNEPEKLSAYEILGLSPSATAVEIKMAYRKRVKECHPDLFAGMDEQGKALAERWTRALNAAYASLNPRNRGARPS